MLDEQIEQGEDLLDQKYSTQPAAFQAPLPPRTGSMRKSKKDAEKWAAEIEQYGNAGASSSRSTSAAGRQTIHVDASSEVGNYKDDLVNYLCSAVCCVCLNYVDLCTVPVVNCDN